PGLRAHASRYQSARFHKSLSQPDLTVWSLLDTACTFGRLTTGITVGSLQTRSFMRMNNAARLTGSSSPSAARNALSYSSLRQPVILRPCHLFSFVAISQEVNWRMNTSGSGCVMFMLYI